jgi:hypothetical protein
MRLRTLIALIAGATTASLLRAQAPGSIAGVVVTQEGGVSLPYGVVSIPALGRERFTTVTGSFVLDDLPPGEVTLMVRRLGYVPKEMKVAVRSGATDTIRVELARVAVQLAAMRVRAYPECKNPGAPHPKADSALATMFTQLVMNAEQYRTLARTYPFAYAMVSVLGHFDSAGVAHADISDTMRIEGLPDWRYKPGRITTPLRGRRRGDIFVNIPTLVDVADPVFIANHCFHNGGMVAFDSVTAFRIDFVAASKIRSPDFNGAIYLDTATYQIRRSTLRVWPLPAVRGLTDMEVTTDFEEALPSIPVILKVSARQWFNTKLRGVVYPMMFDEQQLIDFAFLRGKPGEEKRKP